MAKRDHISLKAKLAAALRELLLIPYEDAKLMTAEQVISLVNFDHGILHGVEVINDHWNLTPRLIAPHRQKSRGDTKTVAKVRRLEKGAEDFRARVLAVEKKPAERRSKWPRRKLRRDGWPKKQKLRSFPRSKLSRSTRIPSE